MRNSGSIIALLLVAVIIFLPSANASEGKIMTVSPQTVCGDTVVQNGELSQNDNELDTQKIIAIVVTIIIVIVVFQIIANTETG